ncbi:hypothetical protein CLU79DRAFT_743813 [Phycomyces nitens]|nr:hypothetical protein CLU79DRAFT_743813 [Phycomyces nitens]
MPQTSVIRYNTSLRLHHSVVPQNFPLVATMAQNFDNRDWPSMYYPNCEIKQEPTTPLGIYHDIQPISHQDMPLCYSSLPLNHASYFSPKEMGSPGEQSYMSASSPTDYISAIPSQSSCSTSAENSPENIALEPYSAQATPYNSYNSFNPGNDQLDLSNPMSFSARNDAFDDQNMRYRSTDESADINLLTQLQISSNEHSLSYYAHTFHDACPNFYHHHYNHHSLREYRQVYAPHMSATLFTPGLHAPLHQSHIENNVRPYKCHDCHRAFARKHDLQRHSRVHTGLKPYSCAGCNKAFARTDALKRHLRMEDVCRTSPEVKALMDSGKRRYKNLI